MEKDDLLLFIHMIPIFHEAADEELNHLAEAAVVTDFAAGEVMVAPDLDDGKLLIVLQGELRMSFIQKESGFEKELRRLFPGDYFGVISAITNRKAQTTTQAITDGQVIVIEHDTIDHMFDTSPSFARAICRALAGRLTQTSEMLGAVQFVELRNYERTAAQAAKLIPPRISRTCQCLAVELDEDVVVVAMANPGDVRARAFLQEVLRKYHVEFVAVAEDDLQRYSAKLLGPDLQDSSPDSAFQSLYHRGSSGEAVELSNQADEDLLRRILSLAIKSGASDVHIEPDDAGGRVRLRVDGKLYAVENEVPPAKLKQASAKIKIMSDLDITNIRRPQDGRFVLMADDQQVEFRVSVAPCQGGEKLVLRVVAPNPDFEALHNLILCEPAAAFAAEMFQSHSGAVLTTGPTGSGKTTTLYAALNTINANDHAINIMTIEDPIEYNLPFATQIQVNSSLGLSFARLLRTVLRQDPDVILVGEIRDQESAGIAMEAATTGHMVLSSLHTDSALESLVRLRNLNVKPYLAAAALRGIVSQQLIPRLQPGFTEPVAKDDPIIGRLIQLEVLEQNFSGTLQKGVSTEHGPPHGESGRVGAYELMGITPELQDLIERSAPTQEIERALTPQSFFSFRKYCRYLLLKGVVSPYRVEQLLPRKPLILE